jgi:CRP/FNR family cyclic AMP-dependent transcriptional regulator
MNSLWGNIFTVVRKERDRTRDILQKIPIFGDLDRRELVLFERILHRREYREGETIFSEGDPGLGMYIIENGTVEIIGGTGEEVLAGLHEGEFFGELALLDDSPRAASAVARSACKLLCFFQPDLIDLLKRNPPLGVKILFRLAQTIGERLKKTNECVIEMKKDLRTRDSAGGSEV